MNPFQILRFINGRKIRLPERDVGRCKLWIALRLGQHRSDGLAGEDQFMSAGSLAQHFEMLGR